MASFSFLPLREGKVCVGGGGGGGGDTHTQSGKTGRSQPGGEEGEGYH